MIEKGTQLKKVIGKGLKLKSEAVIIIFFGLMISLIMPVALGSTVTLTAQDGTSGVDDNTALQMSLSYLQSQTSQWGIQNVNEEFRLRSIFRDQLGEVHVRLDQVYKGVPVFGKQLIVHLNADGSPRSVTGDYMAGINVPTQPRFSGIEAREKAINKFPGKLSETPKAELMLYPGNGGVLLVHRVVLVDEETPRMIVAFVDANTGELVYSYNNLKTPLSTSQEKVQVQQSSIKSGSPAPKPTPPEIPSPATGTGYSLYSGNVSITTNNGSTSYSMIDYTRGGLSASDMKNRPTGSGTIFTDSDNFWGNNLNSDRASAGVDAYFGAGMTWDYYLSNHSRNGIYNDSKGTLSRVHYKRNYNNAFWSDSCKCMTYGDGDGTILSPLVALDVAGHEMTHGVTSATAGLIYSGESGGLDESMSDIFGTMVEFYASTHGAITTPDYWIGEDVYTPGTPGDALRYMDHPTWDGRSIDNYSDYSSGLDVHYSSGIANNAFYLLAEGGTHRQGSTVAKIGHDKAEKIFYRALTVYMTPDETFSKARADTIQAAIDLFGSSSPEVASVEQAWTAVNVV